MASTFLIEYCLSASERQKIIENGSVRLCVEWNDGAEQTKHFYHCLHCDRTFSRSGLFYHRRNINLTPQRKEALALRLLSNPMSQKTVIRDEFERCFTGGELKRRVAISTSPNYPFEFTPVQWQDDPTTNVSHQIERRVNHHDINGFPGRQVYEVHEERDDYQIEDFPPDLNKCFSRDGFDPKRFEEFARDF